MIVSPKRKLVKLISIQSSSCVISYEYGSLYGTCESSWLGYDAGDEIAQPRLFERFHVFFLAGCSFFVGCGVLLVLSENRQEYHEHRDPYKKPYCMLSFVHVSLLIIRWMVGRKQIFNEQYRILLFCTFVNGAEKEYI